MSERDSERERERQIESVTRVVNGNVRHKNIKNFGKTKERSNGFLE